MARRESTKSNELLINDNISGSTLGIYHRMPSTAERQGYQNKSVVRKGRKIKLNIAETRLEYGLKILTGLRDGDFERTVDGTFVPISSRPESEHHYPEWKNWMEEHGADVVMILGAHVFEGSVELADKDDEEESAEGN